MRIKDLIIALQHYDEEMQVVIPGYEGGYDSPEVISTTAVAWNENWKNGDKITWYEGQHGGRPDATEDTRNVVLIS